MTEWRAQWSSNPADYAVEMARIGGTGPLTAISIVRATDHRTLFAGYRDDSMSRILASARELERCDPWMDKLPSDSAIIRAALIDCGYDPDDETDEQRQVAAIGAASIPASTCLPGGYVQTAAPAGGMVAAFDRLADMQAAEDAEGEAYERQVLAERDALLAALKAVLPYAESRAEDMAESAEDFSDAQTLADKACDAVDAAKALVAKLEG